MRNMLYRWLPIVFGCHCRADRSFRYRGQPFPICARCTGELLGMIFSVLLLLFWKPPLMLSCLMLAPLILDGLFQRLTPYESTNIRRLITGILFGIGLMSLFARSIAAAFRFGISIGQKLSLR